MAKKTGSRRGTGKAAASGNERPATRGRRIKAENPRAFSREKQDIFFARLAETANQRIAAEAAGVHTTTIWQWRQRDADFARRWRAALEQGYADVEMRLIAMAMHGVTSESESEKLADGRQRRVTRADNMQQTAMILRNHRATVAAERAARDMAAEAGPAIDHEELTARVKAVLAAIETARRDAHAAQPSDDAAG